MAVEIYLEPELEKMAENTEHIEAWKKQCEELGMEGQLSMLIGEKKEGNPSPYLFMNPGILNTFATLCPNVVSYKKYNKSTIPIEVLAQIALCEKEGYFDAIKIWYDDIELYPVVVGYIKMNNHKETKHLIAGFGDEVLPMEVLKNKAKAKLTYLVNNELERYTNSVSSFVNDFFSGKELSISFNINPVEYKHNYI